MPAWVCGLAFISANLGAQEVIGMGASGAKYGIATSHFYWICLLYTSYIQALKGPLPQIPMIPTGGVNLSTAADFIRAGVEDVYKRQAGAIGEWPADRRPNSWRADFLDAGRRSYLRH